MEGSNTHDYMHKPPVGYLGYRYIMARGGCQGRVQGEEATTCMTICLSHGPEDCHITRPAYRYSVCVARMTALCAMSHITR